MRDDIPIWLSEPQGYEPTAGGGAHLERSLLSVASALRQLRLDGGGDSPLSPSAPVKIALALGAIVLNSLATNLMVTLVLLAFVLVRAMLLPARSLARLANVTLMAAALAFVIALPAALIGQPAAALRLGAKALVSCGLAMEVALTTPAAKLTGSLRALRVPNVVILTLDLALRSIVRLGDVALETLTALKLRSVGRGSDARGGVGGAAGTLLVRAGDAARETFDAMRCRGFDGSYDGAGRLARLRPADAAWALAFALLAFLFARLEGML